GGRDERSAGAAGDQGRAHADRQGQAQLYAVPGFRRPRGGDQRGQNSHDRKQGRAESLYYAQRVSRRVEASAGEEIARVEVGLDDTRGGSRDAAEEQAARAAREKVARVSGCGGFSAARGTEAAGRFAI